MKYFQPKNDDLNKLPNWKRGFKWAFLTWLITYVFLFGFTCYLSTLPSFTSASLSSILQPWWKLSNWLFCLVLTLPIFMLVFAKEALTKKKEKRTKRST